MEQHTLKTVNNYIKANNYSYLDTSVVKILMYIKMLFIFSMPVLIRLYLWQLKAVVFLNCCLICAVLLQINNLDKIRESNI